MSFDLRSNREISSDPFGRFLADLSKRLSAFLSKDQAELVENPEDIFADAQDVESVLKYHSFVMTKLFPVSPTNISYYSATEPDGDKVTLYLGAVWPNLGSALKDSSGYDNDALIKGGEPVLVDGAPFDPGIVESAGNNVKSIAMRFNRPESEFTNDEYMSVPDCVDLFVSGLTIGISYFIRFKIHSLSLQGGLDRTLIEKIDDSTPSNGVLISVSDDGRLEFHVKRGPSDCDSQTAAGTIQTNTVYECWFTYAVAGDVCHIYVNNVDKPLTDPGPPTWHSTLTNHDLSIFRLGEGTSGGHTYGDFYTLMIIRDQVVTPAQVLYHYTNKWTLANVPFGQVAITNYSATTGTSLERISKSQIYKWDVIVVAGGPSFSLSFTNSPSFTSTALSRVSLSRTYKWNVLSNLSRVSLSMTYKWNVLSNLTRISLSRTYKWNVDVTAGGHSFTSTSFTSSSSTT